jgi:GT2 family glycosyltransferase
MSRPCSVVIPNYNGLEFLERCLPSLLEAIAYDGGPHEVIVVDNDSRDGSVAYLERVGSPMQVLALGSNLGFAPACNLGAAAAHHDVLLFLNNDMFFDRGFLGPLLGHFAERDDLFAVSAQIRDWEDEFRVGRVYGRFVLGSFQPGMEQRQRERACYTLYTSGAASAMDRHKFEELGGFDEFLYIYEDVDIGYRAWKRGWKLFHEPRSIVYHKGEATSRRMFSRHQYLTVNFQNRFWFMWKNMTDKQILYRYLALLPLSLGYLLMRYRSPAPLVAFLSALQGLGSIREKRREEALRSILGDREILRFVKENVYVTETG